MKEMPISIFILLIFFNSLSIITGSSSSNINLPNNVPNVWGGNSSAPPGGVLGGCSGWLFGFSGLDGATSELHNFVALIEGDNYTNFDLRFCGLKNNVRRLTITTSVGNENIVKIATNDVIVIGSEHEEDDNNDVVITYASWDVLIGTGVSDTVLDNSSIVNSCSVSVMESSIVALCMEKSTFSLVYTSNSTINEAVELAKKSLMLNIQSVVNDRMGQYHVNLPSVKPGREKLRNKAISIMRVNSLSKEGLIKERWSTPDRMPHTWMWLWDSCFHSLGMNLLRNIPINSDAESTSWKKRIGLDESIKTISDNLDGVEVSWEYLKAVLDAASPDGGIAIQRTPITAGQKVKQTQPPLLSYSVWHNYQALIHTTCYDKMQCANNKNGALDRLKYAFPILEGYLEWDIRERTDPSNLSPLLSWVKGTESGMDNSQRFDADVTNPGNVRSMLAVDFSTFFALDASKLALIAKEIGNTTAYEKWLEISSTMSSAVHNLLWDDKNNFYMDRHAGIKENNGKEVFSTVKSVASFLPMLLDDFPAKDRMHRMLNALATSFNSSIGIPSVALDTETFSTDMWRGPMWINTNYFVYLGSKKYGAMDLAQEILKSTIDCVDMWYEKTGVFYEFYDSKGQQDPRTLLRKGASTGGVRDYHWTAALILQMLVNENMKNTTTTTTTNNNNDDDDDDDVENNIVYLQPEKAVDVKTNVFVNPTHQPKGWPREALDNKTCSVIWQRNHLNTNIITPFDSSTIDVSKLTGIKVQPEQQAVVFGSNHTTPFSAIQYSNNGIYASAINTTNAEEVLTTNTIETSFGECLNVWDNNNDKNSFLVEYELAVPTAFKKFLKENTCAVYASLSINVHTKPGLPNHFIWYETKVFDFGRDVMLDHVFVDTVSQKLIIASPLSGISKYHKLLHNSSKSSNKTWTNRKYFGYEVKSKHLEQGIADGLKAFPSHFPHGMPTNASDYCISGFNLELEATPDAGAGINLHNLRIKING